jgi:serine/threonine-protein kinase
VDGLLGEGGMARVFDGFDQRLERRVAVKVLRPETRALPGMRQRFQREARIAARLVHPNIVAVLDYGEDDESSYLVMERLPGTTLRDEIVRGPLSQRRLANVTTETLAALAAAHRCGVLHRDIKPSNILIQEDGHAKLTDFGIAKSFDLPDGIDGQPDDLTLTGVVLGTPGYLAPERRSGRPATVQSDLYSVGAVLVEAATARRALSDATATPEALIPPFRHVAQRALAAEPSDRFESAEAMQRALLVAPPPPTELLRAAPASPTQPLQAPTPPVPSSASSPPTLTRTGTASLPAPAPDSAPTHRRTRKRRRTLLLALIAVVAVAIALFGLLSGGSQPTDPAATAGFHHAARAAGQRQSTTTTTQDPEVSAITSLSDSLSNGGLPGGAALATALEVVAQQPAGPSRQAAAQQALDLAQVLRDGGGITQTQYEDVVNTLEPTGAAPTPTTTVPTPLAPAGPSGGAGGPLGGHHHGHDSGPGPGG